MDDPDLTHDQRPDGWSAAAGGYDDAFAPYTGPYAAEALRLAGVRPGDRVLDVAAGSGALSRRAARLGAEVHAVDFAPGMVELLRERLAADGVADARVEVMDGQALELDDARYDAAFSVFGLIFFPDIARGLRELHRVVRPGGTVTVVAWRIEGFRLVSLVGGALAKVLPGFEPPTEPPAWARLGDAEGLTGQLEGAGLGEVEVHLVTRHWQFEDATEFFRRLPDWSPPVQPLFEALPAEMIDDAAAAFAELVDEVTGPDGMAVDALVAIGRRAPSGS
jgi:SAM-dependent methyltransferase